MNVRFRFIALVLVVLFEPCALSAQRGGGGGGGRGGGRNGGGEGRRSSSAPEFPTGIDIDKLDPIAMLLSNQKELELTPEMVGTLSSLDAQLVRGTKPILAIVDSLRSAVKAAAESPDSRGAVRESVNAYNKAVGDIRAQGDEAIKKALELLAGEPKKKAEKMLQARREEFDKVTKTKAPEQ